MLSVILCLIGIISYISFLLTLFLKGVSILVSGYDPDFARAFGAFIRDGRISKKLSQQDLAKKLGITQSFCSRLEQGLRNVDLEQALVICAFLDLDINEFVLKLRGAQSRVEETEHNPDI